MRPRYLLVMLEPGSCAAAPTRHISEATGLREILRAPGWVLFTSGECRFLALGDHGVLVGTLFRRDGGMRPVERLEPEEVDAIVRSKGKGLVTCFWGGWVAAVSGADGRVLLRDPSGALSCYFAQGNGHAAFASDAGLLIAGSFTDAALDWGAVGRHLYAPDLPVSETALGGVRELLPGFATLSSSTDEQYPIWSPWHHVKPPAEDAGGAAARLAEVVGSCVSAWAGVQGRLLVSVSGGLDSSIVAAVLARVGHDAVCLTMYGDDPKGDERCYARALCEHLGLRLVARRESLHAIDVETPLAPHLPRPTGRTHALSYERAHMEAAAAIGAGAFMTGNGGDAVFGYSQSAAPVVDRYLVEGLSSRLLATLAHVSRQTGCSVYQAAASGFRMLRRPAGYRWHADRLFLHRDLVAGLDERDLRHPWLEAPQGALPGKRAHVAGLLRTLTCLEPGRSSELPVLHPLMSQPIVETCLGIQSWEWRAGGRDRAIAREAFAPALPALIVERRVKGGPDGFSATIFAQFRAGIRERLLDGHLVRQGIVDAEAISRSLMEERPVLGEERVRILELLSAEAWLAHWSGSAARAHGGHSR